MLVSAVGLGVLLGLGLFTFIYAEGFSYFTTDPKACKSSHHIVAGCVDCHLPKSLVPKLVAKAVNGYHHSKGFTFQDFHEPVMIKPHNSQILQEACLGCHGGLVHDMVAGSTTDANAVSCVHCHSSVGHGPVR